MERKFAFDEDVNVRAFTSSCGSYWLGASRAAGHLRLRLLGLVLWEDAAGAVEDITETLVFFLAEAWIQCMCLKEVGSIRG